MPESPTPIKFDAWTGARYRHAAANDPRVRAAEPSLPDVTGEKYIVIGEGPPSGAMALIPAIERMLDQDAIEDRVVAVGSHRPVLVWRADLVRLDYVGASPAEVRAAEDSGLLDDRGEDHVILRVRMRRSTLDRIRHASEHVRARSFDPEGRKGKYMSTWALSVLLDALAALEAEIATLRVARFSGSTPDE